MTQRRKPKTAPTESQPGTCFIIGGATSVWHDLDEARKQFGECDVVAVNDVGEEYSGPLKAWVSIHGEQFPKWTRKRAANGYDKAELLVTGSSAMQNQPNLSEMGVQAELVLWPEQTLSGSSGLFAVKVTLTRLSYQRVILCGVPMCPTYKHYFDKQEWDDAPAYWPGWRSVYEQHLKGRVFSMSGWTRNLLGHSPYEMENA